jgi:uncharacterized membrane protein
MKCVGTILLVFVLGHKIAAQELAWLQVANSNYVQFSDLERPYVPLLVKPPGKRMARTGRTLTLVGAGMVVGGLIYFNANSNNTTGAVEDGMVDGLVLTAMVSGAVMMVPGVICWTVGSSRYKAYDRQIKGSVSFGQNGLGLRYYF